MPSGFPLDTLSDLEAGQTVRFDFQAEFLCARPAPVSVPNLEHTGGLGRSLTVSVCSARSVSNKETDRLIYQTIFYLINPIDNVGNNAHFLQCRHESPHDSRSYSVRSDYSFGRLSRVPARMSKA